MKQYQTKTVYLLESPCKNNSSYERMFYQYVLLISVTIHARKLNDDSLRQWFINSGAVQNAPHLHYVDN